MEMDFESGEEDLGSLLEPLEIIPPAVAGQLSFEVAPQALNQVEWRCVGGQKEWLELLCVGAPPLAHSKTRVIARIVEHDHQRLSGGNCLEELLEEGHEGGFVFAGAQDREELSTGVVQGAEDGALLVGASGRDPHGMAFLAPDLCQMGMGVDLALIHVDQMGSRSGSASRGSCGCR